MKQEAESVMKNAYAPYSGFSVGASILAQDGKCYSGCNVENVSYGVTQCAEASAIGAMVAAGCTHIREIIIVSSQETYCYPCGACRQRIGEFASDKTIVHVCAGQDVRSVLLKDLMPHPFYDFA